MLWTENRILLVSQLKSNSKALFTLYKVYIAQDCLYSTSILRSHLDPMGKNVIID